MEFLGVHLEQSHISIALLRKSKKNIEIELLRHLPANVKPLDMAALIQNKSPTIVSGLEASELIVRTLDLPIKRKREILKALPFQLESLIPYSLDEVLVHPLFYRKRPLSIICTANKNLESHLLALEEFAIDPEVVSCTPLALQSYANHCFPECETLLIYHLSPHQATIVGIEEGRLKFSLTHSIDHLEREIERALLFIKKKMPSVEKLLLTGEMHPQARKFLENSFTLLNHPEKTANFAIPIGLALDACKHGCQFRTQKYTAPFVQKNRSKKLTALLTASLASFLITISSGWLYLHQREKVLATSLQSIFPSKMESLTKAISTARENLSNKRSLLPPVSPKMNDLLAWLSQDPKFQGTISIEHVHYELKNGPRLEITFTCTNPNDARVLREKLMADKQMIDSSREVKWIAKQGRYIATFNLKKA